MKQRTATIIGFLVAPIVPALALGFFTPVLNGEPNVVTILGMAPIGYLFAAVATAMFGIPAFLVLKRRRLIRWWSAGVTGFVIGLCLAIAFQWPSAPVSPLQLWIVDTIRGGFPMAVSGALSGIVFWLIWTKGDQGPFFQGTIDR